MAMDINEWNELSRQIVAAAGDQAALTSLVTRASDEYSGLFAEHANFDNERQNLKADNEALRKANMELFIQLTEQRGTSLIENSTKPNSEEERAKQITIQDLFKEGD